MQGADFILLWPVRERAKVLINEARHLFSVRKQKRVLPVATSKMNSDTETLKFSK